MPINNGKYETPKFKWYGSHGDYLRLKSFDCRAHAHIKREKIEARALKVHYAWLPERIGGYRLWSMEQSCNKQGCNF